MKDDQTNDVELVRRAQAGDEPAFEEIVRRHKRPVVNFVYRLTGSAEDANDLGQEVFVRAWRALPRFQPRPGAQFSTWLFQIARNACTDFIRRAQRDPLHALTTDRPADAPAPAAGRETGERVAAAVAALPEDQRTAVVLAEYEGLSHAEIAAVMDCSVKSVESRLYRARQTLRQALAGLLPT